MGEVLEEAALPPLLELFYSRVRADRELGPVFDGAVHDWPAHLARLADFWSSVMLTSGRYKGNPMLMHLKHGDSITASMFARWLELWKETTDELLPPATARGMQAKADRIAESLQLALKLHTGADRAALLAHDAAATPRPYRSTPVFDEVTLPAALRTAHRTKAGAWGVIRVLEGRVCYHLDDGSAPPTILTPNQPGLISPEQPHHVEPLGRMQMQVEFYDEPPVLIAG